ncbi:hypothetical protein GH733_017817 [Mirounga leonina]|nr:hypothetical protein GH733_017817 [Mirounga leonina]
MILISIKPIAWAYSMITLGTEMLNSVFSFYYVKLFLHLYKISEVAFYQAQPGVLLAEIFTRHESRLQLIKISQVTSLVGCTSVLFCALISDNMEILLSFQAVAVVTAILAAASIYTGIYHMKHFEPARSPGENLFSESEQDLPWTSVVSLMRQILTQKNFRLFLIMNFLQVFHLTFFNNFMMIFADNLIPKDVLPSSIRSIMYGAGFICPQSWLKKFGYYKIILISFYLEGTASIVMLPLSSMVFGINALFTKPAQSLAPMMILSKLKEYGYGNPDKR